MENKASEHQVSVDSVGFSTRVFNTLASMGIDNLDRLAALTERDLYRWPNLGRKSVNEIKDHLATYGLSLGTAFGNADVPASETTCGQTGKSMDEHIRMSIGNRVAFLEKASRAGYGSADNQLGYLYLEGLGVPTDYRKARLYFIRAARRGCRQGLWNLALMYRIGYGVRRSQPKEQRWMACWEAASAMATSMSRQA